jgi:DNA-binding MarR family transcriptional regulator
MVKSLYHMDSTRQHPPSRFPDDPNPDDPLIGARLRYVLGAVEARIGQSLMDAGFTDIHLAHFKVLRFPPPENERPGDLAHRAGTTKQAMNYLLVQLEELGYVRRSSGQGSGRRISLTDKGWKVAQIQRATVRAVEREWASKMGTRRFETFQAVLKELADQVDFDGGRP